MTTITPQVPDVLEKNHDETVRFFAAKLYEAGKLSLGQAAEMCGMKKWDFPKILAEFNVPYFQYFAEDMIKDANAILI
jgi:predicted HTH domain antitoxin